MVTWVDDNIVDMSSSGCGSSNYHYHINGLTSNRHLSDLGGSSCNSLQALRGTRRGVRRRVMMRGAESVRKSC